VFDDFAQQHVNALLAHAALRQKRRPRGSAQA
jgi:hypothetical protein